MTDLKDISLEAKNLAAVFEATGAEVVELDFLQISNILLDLSNSIYTLQNNFDAADIKLMNEDQWIDESQQIVNKVYSEVKNKDNLGYNYIYKNFDLVKLQLFKAGVRLASTLNEIFDE